MGIVRNNASRATMVASASAASSLPLSAVNTDLNDIAIHEEHDEIKSASEMRQRRSLSKNGSLISGRRRLSRQGSFAGEKKLLSESWPGSHHIRRLFRLFDKDGNGAISTAELRAGLSTLGFDVHNVKEFQRLQSELDVDSSGVIRESQFIRAFRLLNRSAIEAKLKKSSGNTEAGAASPASSTSSTEDDTPCTIQLMKLGHTEGGGGENDHSVAASFHHTKSISPSELSDVLTKEEELFASGTDLSIRWIDVCGLHPGVLALLSNLFYLPHELLGEEIELAQASHAEFFVTKHEPDSGEVNVRQTSDSDAPSENSAVRFTVDTEAKEEEEEDDDALSTVPEIHAETDSPVPAAFSDEHEVAAPVVSGLEVAASSSSAPGIGPSSPSPLASPGATPATTAGTTAAVGSGTNSTTDTVAAAPTAYSPTRGAFSHMMMRSPSMVGDSQHHSILKLLIHSLRFHNFPLRPVEGSNKTRLISYRNYRSYAPVISQLPVHMIVVNEHTLITVRPLLPVPSAINPADLPLDFDSDPNCLFDDFISTLSDTDSTSFSSSLSISSAKILMVRLWEDVIDSNWSMRDLMKEWKVWLGDHNGDGDVSDRYYRHMVADLDRLASSCARQFKAAMSTAADLSGEIDHSAQAEASHTRSIASHYKKILAASDNKKHLRSSGSSAGMDSSVPAKTDYLKDVHTSLRVIHRATARQYDEALLTVSLSRALSEQYTQRIRDASNDTLYLLTVVTTIVTPLQIFAGVYGMNFDNIPELHYENSYYWFWGINIAVIFLIALMFKFRATVAWAREQIN